MSVLTVLNGLKTIIEANGYTVETSGTGFRDGVSRISITAVTPDYQENSSRHIANIACTLVDKVKPKDRFASEASAATRVEIVMKSLKDGFRGFATQMIIDGATITETDDFRIAEIQLTVIYAV